MVLIALIMTGVITPIVTVLYRPVKKSVSYKRRTIQQTKPDSELRVLVCAHTPRNVPTIINLLEASHPTKSSPICIYVLHLVELTGRASAMLIVHNTRKSGRPALNGTQAQSDHIINAFENYEQHAAFVAIQPLTAISPYSTMHEDVCSLAEDKRVSFIIIPFHKQQTVDGGMEATNPAYRLVNQNLLENTPSSVGILVDRGLNGATRLNSNTVSLQVAVLFFGGPDDREALAYAWRMAQHPGIILIVLRFTHDGDDTEVASTRATNESDQKVPKMNLDMKKQRQLDDEYINNFRAENAALESL
ncbi:Cation/H(+) antiporter 15 [Cardamine amara subsp. amara]|uniref:Cation/H(+) antiporter 15 n=1 Tax=Cardamine amara subsp. amara TaxID=228776 RepID=A0ABD1C653_CARAN